MHDHEEILKFVDQFASVSDEMQRRVREYRKRLGDADQLNTKIDELRSSLLEFGTDRELVFTIMEEIRYLKSNLLKLRSNIDEYLRNIFHSDFYTLKVISGVGGREAEIFAGELMERYSKVLGRLHQQEDWISLDKDEYELLRYEIGVHRVQRVPVTENAGRIHTSTVSVCLNPNLRNFNLKLNKRDLKIETMRSSGAGGQHVNTTSSAVRVTHLPTGLSCRVGTRRDQWDNKKEALETVLERVSDYINGRLEELMSEERSQQSMKRGRSDKCRTYNFPQDRITDHRVNITQNNLKMIWSDSELWKDFIGRIKRAMD